LIINVYFHILPIFLKVICILRDTFCFKRYKNMQGPVAHACKPRYLGGRDREDYCSRPPKLIPCKTPSQPIVGHGGAQLSSQLHTRLMLGGLWLRANLSKRMLLRPHLNAKKLGIMALTCHPSNGRKFK
jgi:hypothetical protein